VLMVTRPSMHCSACGFENASNMKFCGECRETFPGGLEARTAGTAAELAKEIGQAL
jgi:hypothetical protein